MLRIALGATHAPWFWTDPCGLNIQVAGDPGAAEWIVRGTLEQPPCVLFGLDAGGALADPARDLRVLARGAQGVDG